ncbi:MAG: VacJ family lipoprotein [Verrucomicrobia bacterium]|nr:VacJ family lipoprotein [Verrucomicrobiota bacterium]
MKARIAIFLLSFSCIAFANEEAKPGTQDQEFHDPFAAEDAVAQPKISDPLEPMNRAFYHFNDKLYSWVLRPVSKGYRAVAPKAFRESVERAFANVKYPVRLVNNVLEGRFKSAGIETTRFVVNTTVGLGGLFDPAARWHLQPQLAAFDQTLAVYRVPSGIYLHWPILGASSVRGSVGTAGDIMLSPLRYLDTPWGYGAEGVNKINMLSLHSEEYDALKEATLDPYVALRSAYFESRARKE